MRWNWLKDELMSFAKRLGHRAGGSNDVLAARIAARLGGRQFVEPDPAPRANTAQLSGRLSAETLITLGQRSSQVVSAWILDRIGAIFRFDAAMCSFFAQSDGGFNRSSQHLEYGGAGWHEDNRTLTGRSDRSSDPRGIRSSRDGSRLRSG